MAKSKSIKYREPKRNLAGKTFGDLRVDHFGIFSDGRFYWRVVCSNGHWLLMSHSELRTLAPCERCVAYARGRMEAEREYQKNHPPDSALPVYFSDEALESLAAAGLKPRKRTE